MLYIFKHLNFSQIHKSNDLSRLIHVPNDYYLENTLHTVTKSLFTLLRIAGLVSWQNK